MGHFIKKKKSQLEDYLIIKMDFHLVSSRTSQEVQPKDASNLRAWKSDASGRLYYLYDGSDPVAELDSSGNIQAVNTFGAGGLVSRRTAATNASVFYTFDERGNVAQRLDSYGSVLSTDLYDAFGGRTGTASQSTSSSGDPWGFVGQWGYQTDNETGLVLCTHRFYDPQQGRFLTRDPLGYDGGVNLYGYTANNPVNWMDPDGTDPVTDWYMNGMGGTSDWVDQHLMAGTATHLGNVTGNYDSGKASGLEVAGAGAEAFGMGLVNAIPVARGLTWARAGFPALKITAGMLGEQNSIRNLHFVYSAGGKSMHALHEVGTTFRIMEVDAAYTKIWRPFPISLRLPLFYPSAAMRSGGVAKDCFHAALGAGRRGLLGR